MGVKKYSKTSPIRRRFERARGDQSVGVNWRRRWMVERNEGKQERRRMGDDRSLSSSRQGLEAGSAAGLTGTDSSAELANVAAPPLKRSIGGDQP